MSKFDKVPAFTPKMERVDGVRQVRYRMPAEGGFTVKDFQRINKVHNEKTATMMLESFGYKEKKERGKEGTWYEMDRDERIADYLKGLNRIHNRHMSIAEVEEAFVAHLAMLEEKFG